MGAFLIAMLAGFAGSFHCVGMCGGFACGLAQTCQGSKTALVLHSLLYNTGRVVTYAFIGALAGLVGRALIGGHAHSVGLAPDFAIIGMETTAEGLGKALPMPGGHGMVLAGEVGWAQRGLSILAGVLMLIMACELFGLRRSTTATWARLGGESFAKVFRTLLLSKRPSAALALGVANGFLPCPLVYAFAAAAVAAGTVVDAVLLMTAFGLGTFPAMAVMGAVGFLMTPLVRKWGVRFAGAFVLMIGLVTILRGILPDLLHGMPMS